MGGFPGGGGTPARLQATARTREERRGGPEAEGTAGAERTRREGSGKEVGSSPYGAAGEEGEESCGSSDLPILTSSGAMNSRVPTRLRGLLTVVSIARPKSVSFVVPSAVTTIFSGGGGRA